MSVGVDHPAARFATPSWHASCYVFSDMSNYDLQNIGSILAGEGSWFNAHLLRLIAKADSHNIELLRKSFPYQVNCVEAYRSGTLV